MGDSDDERHSRSRDKFKRERDERDDRDYERGSGGGRRDDHDHGRRTRDYDRRPPRDYDRYRERELPYSKRPKRDESPGHGAMPPAPFYPPSYPPPYPMAHAPAPWPMPDMSQHAMMPSQNNDKNSDQMYMKRFKQFVLSLKDDINEDQAVTEYRKYRSEFKRSSISKFFKMHKNEEWLKERYHPDYVERKKKELRACKVKRLDVYRRVMDLGLLNGSGVCHEDQERLMKALDAAVILMEGGTEFDLTILDGRNGDKPLVAIPVTKLKKEKPKDKEDDNSDDSDGQVVQSPASPADDEKKLPQPLHKPQSLFVRSLTPLITRDDLLQVVRNQNIPGFLRLAMDKPQPDRKYYRRAWVTFAHNTDIKEACQILMNSKVEKYDHDLNVVINRELSKRVRFVPAYTRSLFVLQDDVKYLEQLLTVLDTSAKLWNVAEPLVKDDDEDGTENDNEGEDVAYEYHNPMIEELRRYHEQRLQFPVLERELDQGETDEDEIHMISDDRKLDVIDKAILYLRIVHMVDYYNATEFPNEDEMPNKIGVFHIRGPAEAAVSKSTLQDVNEWKAQFKGKIEAIIDELKGVTINKEEQQEIGLKKEEEAVEDFVRENTEEQGPGKYLCPLSGKKFKGPEFVRKHIFNKHAEKVENVKKDAVFWNNYVLDPKRQMNPLFAPVGAHTNPSHHNNVNNVTPSVNTNVNNRGNYHNYPSYSFPTPFPPAPAPKGRKVVNYNDLDAPDEYDVLGL